jgi:hypothetical protein
MLALNIFSYRLPLLLEPRQYQISEKRKKNTVTLSVVELHHFYAALAPGKNFHAAPATPAPPLQRRSKFLKGIKVNIRSDILFSSYSV